MDKMDNIEVNISEGSTVSNPFVFSKPSNIFHPSRVINFGVESDHVFDTHSNKKNIFTFAAPMMLSQHDQSLTNSQANKSNRCKPRISRATYEPTVNVFASALKDTGAFEQLKKNSRSHITKINIDNSITCSNVPKTLLTKTAAKEYFIKYGNIVKITIRPRKCTIIVVYTSKMEANAAYYGSSDYMGEKFHVEWTKLESSTKVPAKKKIVRKNIVTNLLKATDDEIKNELEAMANLEYNLHSDKEIKLSDNTGTFLPLKVRAPAGKTANKFEKTAVKIEKSDTESQIIKPLPNTSIEELQNIIHHVALTTEDKYKILEARDRIMRMKRVKPASLATAKVTSGTCPDMCPEKERLMRESQRQIASYEQLEGNEYKINHATAVKQYSRSSADQEEPMPHELRPVKSLKMTMSYLLHEIMDLCEQEDTNLAEWYHFLWDRTRGIRKDITQQELCCVESVELIEQCARFHIVCSERLCAEDASVFDKKINTENLTKCLQTLKYMYQDLRLKGVICENESEFRAYIVLLNLNNGNFLYDLQQLPKSVQNSPKFQFAIKTYFALDSNNYYKFFQLVRETTYLNACILLRYFNEVRLKALSVMVKAYCRSTLRSTFPLYELIDILGFENENETKYFCEQVGLNLSNDELYILLNRRNFCMPAASSIQQGRAYNLIESKRIALNFTIGQCIAGKKMPEKTYKNHKPHDSFNAYGCLMPESINAIDQNTDVSSIKQHEYKHLDEFTEKKTKMSSVRDKNQKAMKDVRPMQIKKQSANTDNISSIPKLISVSESITSNVFQIMTSNASIGLKPKISNIFEYKPQPCTSATQIKVASDKQSDNENAITGTVHHENITTEDKQSEIFSSNNIFSNNAFTNNPITFSKLETSHNVESATPFAMPTNQNVFSEIRSEDIFIKNMMPSSMVFANNYFLTPFSTQHSTNVSDGNKITENQTIAPKKEQKVQEDTVQTILETEKVKLEKLEHMRKMQQIEEQSKEIYNSLYEEIVHEFCSDIVRENIEKIKMYDTLSEKILFDMTGEIIHEICKVVLTEEINHQQKLQAMLSRIKNRVVVKCFNAWKQYTSRKKRQRKALEDTPVWLQRQSVEENARMLYSKEQEVVMQNMREKQHQLEDITSMETLAPIEVIAYAGIKENLRLLDISPLTDIFWKLVISWPDLGNRTVLWHYKKVMNEYLYPDDFTMDPIIKIYEANPYETLHVCIRHLEGFISEDNLIGTDALLFIADASENYKFVAKRLTRIVLARHKLMPMPLACIILGHGNLKIQNENIVSVLESFLESGHILEYTIMYKEDLSTKVILNLIQSVVLWLTMNKSPSIPLEMDYLYNIYNICLSEELWLRILGDAIFNKQLSNALENPNFVINLHNEAVNHLMDIILDPESMLYTNFAPELKKFLKNSSIMPCSYEHFDESWKQDEYRAKLETTMNSFVLPPWKNHIKHFQTLPWWFKSNVLTKFLSHELNFDNHHMLNEPAKKRKKLNNSTNDLHDSVLNEKFGSLAEFCEDTKAQVVEIHSVSKKIENRLQIQQLENTLLEERLKNALFDEENLV
ncbi:protein xmas-2 [Lasius niger]|uniref:Protein xmas-2 n=1 Tax=Lasius niger TaxID=67767 RepID=A0A0J7NF50_LASNI|nr:protein xmas-2 [Lasius niger]